MGFDFNKSAQGSSSSPVDRTPASNIGATLAAPVTAPTSPQYALNYSLALTYFLNNNIWTKSLTSASTNATISASSGEWIDLVGIYNENSNTLISNIYIDGSSISFQNLLAYGGFGTDVLTFDIYGYGRTVSLSVTTSPASSFGAFVLHPQTIITESGSVVNPYGLSGRSVAKDI